MKEGVFLVETTNYTFEMCVIHYGTTYTIKYGDSTNREDGPCIEITYDTKKDYIAKLENLTYNMRCSQGKPLEKREGTHEMLKSILKILVTEFPNIKRILFKDVSAFECNGRKIWLSYYGLLIDGKTWYEKHFGAKCLDRDIKQYVENFKSLLQQKPQRNIFPFAKDYKVFDTWNDYFKSINDCTYFVPHMDIIERISAVKLVYSDWYIPVRNILDYNVNIISIKKIKKKYGGGSLGLVVVA